MSSLKLHLADTAATEELGRCLAEIGLAPAIVYLSGELGAGKTTFSRGFIQACGHHGAVKSPTYTLIEPYELASGQVFHLDLYRLNDAAELDFLGLEDLISSGGVCLIEWPERASSYLPPADLTISLQHSGGSREVTLTAHSARAEAWLAIVAAHFGSSLT